MEKIVYNGKTYSGVKDLKYTNDTLILTCEDDRKEAIELNLVHSPFRDQPNDRVKIFGNVRVGSLSVSNYALLEGKVLNLKVGNCLTVLGTVEQVVEGGISVSHIEHLKHKIAEEKRELTKRQQYEKKRKIVHLYGSFDNVIVDNCGACEVHIIGEVYRASIGNCCYVSGEVGKCSASNQLYTSKLPKHSSKCVIWN